MAAAGFSAALLLACAGCTSIAVDARTFAGTSWRVQAINGHATPAAQRFSMEFAEGSFRARMGCNEAGGGYRIAGDTLVPAMIRATQMACEAEPPTAIPLMTYERWGFGVLGQPMNIRWLSGRRLILRNSSGSIELERLP
jgi:heat shock protein HslJ